MRRQLHTAYGRHDNASHRGRSRFAFLCVTEILDLWGINGWELVSQIFASWNHISRLLLRIQALRQVT